LVEAVRGQAENAAVRASAFLDELLPQIAPAMPRTAWRFPAAFLLQLGTTLWLHYWEQHGITVHRDAGLPPAAQLVVETFQSLTRPGDGQAWSRAERLAVVVMGLFVEHLAWHGDAEMGAEFVVGPADDDAFVEVLAQFLWQHRQNLPADPLSE
jgi:hypothetical protein